MFTEINLAKYIYSLDMDQYSNLGKKDNIMDQTSALGFFMFPFSPSTSIVGNKLVVFKSQYNEHTFYLIYAKLSYGQVEITLLNLTGTDKEVKLVTDKIDVVKVAMDAIRRSGILIGLDKKFPLMFNPLKGDLFETSTFLNLN